MAPNQQRNTPSVVEANLREQLKNKDTKILEQEHEIRYWKTKYNEEVAALKAQITQLTKELDAAKELSSSVPLAGAVPAKPPAQAEATAPALPTPPAVTAAGTIIATARPTVPAQTPRGTARCGVSTSTLRTPRSGAAAAKTPRGSAMPVGGGVTPRNGTTATKTQRSPRAAAQKTPRATAASGANPKTPRRNTVSFAKAQVQYHFQQQAYPQSSVHALAQVLGNVPVVNSRSGIILSGARTGGAQSKPRSKHASMLLQRTTSEKKVSKPRYTPEVAATIISKVWRGWVQRKRYLEIGSRRRMLLFELATTERTYSDNMKPLLLFKQTLLDGVTTGKAVISQQDIADIFCNCDVIVCWCEQLLAMLDTRIHKWNCHRCVGDIWLTMMDTQTFPQMYLFYITNYTNSLATLEHCKQKKLFRQKLKEFEDKYCNEKGTGLHSLLILPVQRVMRYKMLFTDAASLTDSAHPDYDNLKKCLEIALRVCELTNAEQGKHQTGEQCMQQLRDMDRLFSPKIKDFVNSSHWLLRQGAVSYCDEDNGWRDLAYFLLTDMLVLAKRSRKKLEIRIKTGLRGLRMRILPDNQEFMGQRLVNAWDFHCDDGSFLFRAPTAEERDAWLVAVTDAAAAAPPPSTPATAPVHHARPTSAPVSGQHTKPPLLTLSLVDGPAAPTASTASLHAPHSVLRRRRTVK
eukprot:TRINITY_DN7866_c0_g1_i5.p1 TRINITY_DN7866_c0_g1~~TRINITY_DN7866_c0_g1_i5.p1  ORF type:complete len:745 (-),score=149.80 TRINITY_DN7866_c0_g1_i5:7-2073(-)